MEELRKIIDKEKVVTIWISKKKRYNISVCYKHTNNLRFYLKSSTETEEKKELDSVIDRSVDRIANSLYLLSMK